MTWSDLHFRMMTLKAEWGGWVGKTGGRMTSWGGGRGREKGEEGEGEEKGEGERERERKKE